VTEAEAMRRALDLAYRGWGRVSPNPLVGAVVLGPDGVIGEGFHGEYGGPHAEAVALAGAADRVRGATLLTTP
jgi:diaminohydroxyphosphoribosylaminopyrimidine deaminase/5-amino-6-(5-phosphoribosylamino)uracil reductase